MTSQAVAGPARSAARSSLEWWPLVAVGGICGLAWAAALRGLGTQIVGAESSVFWAGTFGWILLPGVVAGLLLGWAEHVRRTGVGAGWPCPCWCCERATARDCSI
jgi:hypothetical protein